MKERLKLLREHLDLNQAQLAARVGVTRSAISRLESGDINFTEQMVKSICREFHASYDWLKDGTGDMFEMLPESLVDELAMEFDLDELDQRIILSYLRLSESDRSAVKRYIQGILGGPGQK